MNISRAAILLVVLAMGRVCAMERDELTYPTIEQGSPGQVPLIVPDDTVFRESKKVCKELYLEYCVQLQYFFREGHPQQRYLSTLAKNVYEARNAPGLRRLLAQIKVTTQPVIGCSNGDGSDDDYDDLCVIL